MDSKIPVLGTALWGWGVDRDEAFRMMDRYVGLGGRYIDTASNYPINKRPADYGRAEQWIREWLDAHPDHAVKVWIKVGALDNMGSPTNDLSALRLERLFEHYKERFGGALGVFAVHWDNRGETGPEREAVRGSLSVLAGIGGAGVHVGMSGVKHPALYAELQPGLADKWWIQVKENIASEQARQRYLEHFPDARYFAYGINMGGVKAGPSSADSSTALRGVSRPEKLVERLENFLESDHGLKPAPRTFNELALMRTFLNPGLSGVILGPRNVEQLDASLEYWNRLHEESSPGMYEPIARLSDSIR